MKVYDITIPISENTPIFPGDSTVKINLCEAISKGNLVNVSELSFCVHTGTHIDAPNHFINGGKQSHEIDLGKLIGKCQVIELENHEMSVEPKHVEHLENVERVLFKTRNSNFWNESEKGFREDFTYISPEAAKMLVEKEIKLVGIDYLSVDKFGSEDFQTHITLLEKEIVIIETLDLREVSEGEYELICLPLKYFGGGGDGSPARTILRK